MDHSSHQHCRPSHGGGCRLHTGHQTAALLLMMPTDLVRDLCRFRWRETLVGLKSARGVGDVIAALTSAIQTGPKVAILRRRKRG